MRKRDETCRFPTKKPSTGYGYGCRCDRCLAGMRLMQAKYRRKREEERGTQDAESAAIAALKRLGLAATALALAQREFEAALAAQRALADEFNASLPKNSGDAVRMWLSKADGDAFK